MRRSDFLVLGAAPVLGAAAGRIQEETDPAVSSPRQALRVLLGPGEVAQGSDRTFQFEGKLYRGSFERTLDGQIVNVIDLESYLYSVVPREMPSGWPVAALQAQAICARTYVLQRSDPRREYDLVPSELDQVYDGIAGETPQGVAAVDASSGRVLSFGGAFAQIAYSSCCGGHTESSADAWGGSIAPPYLEGIVCTWCTGSPNYRWSRSFAFDAIEPRLSTALVPLGALRDIRITLVDASGRVRTFELITDQGSISVPGNVFRRNVGARALPSLLLTNLERTPDGSGISMEGGGLGHGVGLCQWGARGMALSQRDAPTILNWYFPGTVLQYLR